MSDLDIADVIIESMPFSKEIIYWCQTHPEFKEALKVSNPDRFHALGLILTSKPKSKPDDYVIGFVAYDMEQRIFKQDFIVDLAEKHTEFVLYTNLPSKKYGKYVHHIKEFYALYGKDGDYANTHHFDIGYLLNMGNEELSERAISVVEKSQMIIEAGGRRSVSQKELKEIFEKIKLEKY